ncbi:MAG: glutamate--tRNA ligase family protein, partial [Betaproteobacteria bacterium]|nr:glutamate--tRNA ligase family protein [Betaproteobacteria bacterium]
DAEQGITDVVRGADLLESTARQIHLQELLGCARPRYLHVPVIVNPAGEKLSKQTAASPIDLARPAAALTHALEILGQAPPTSSDARELLAWAQTHWVPANIARQRTVATAIAA